MFCHGSCVDLDWKFWFRPLILNISGTLGSFSLILWIPSQNYFNSVSPKRITFKIKYWQTTWLNSNNNLLSQCKTSFNICDSVSSYENKTKIWRNLNDFIFCRAEMTELENPSRSARGPQTEKHCFIPLIYISISYQMLKIFNTTFPSQSSKTKITSRTTLW